MPIENINNDPVFQKFILNIQKQASEIQDIHILQEYISDSQLSEMEKDNIHMAFGYTDKALFWKDQALQNNRLLYLNKSYDLKNIAEKDKIIAIEKTFVTLKLFSQPLSKEQIQPLLATNTCEKIRVNCIASVAAQAVAMHIGCAAIDLSIIGGVLCHGAALTYQYTAGNNCNLEAEKCNGVSAN